MSQLKRLGSPKKEDQEKPKVEHKKKRILKILSLVMVAMNNPNEEHGDQKEITKVERNR